MEPLISRERAAFRSYLSCNAEKVARQLLFHHFNGRVSVEAMRIGQKFIAKCMVGEVPEIGINEANEKSMQWARKLERALLCLYLGKTSTKKLFMKKIRVDAARKKLTELPSPFGERLAFMVADIAMHVAKSHNQEFPLLGVGSEEHEILNLASLTSQDWCSLPVFTGPSPTFKHRGITISKSVCRILEVCHQRRVASEHDCVGDDCSGETENREESEVSQLDSDGDVIDVIEFYYYIYL